MQRARVRFLVAGVTVELIERIEFYRNDLGLLRDLADVEVATRLSDLNSHVDLTFAWWWTRALPGLVLNRMQGRRESWVVTGATNGGNPIGTSQTFNAMTVAAERLAGSLANRNLAISRVEESRLRALHMPRVELLTLAVDTEYYAVPTTRRRVPGLLVTVAHVNPASLRRKGVLRAIELLAHLPPCYQLLIIGELQGGEAVALSLAEELAVLPRVQLVGLASREDKRSLLQQAEAYVQLSAYEGFGAACAEAMAAATPIIASDQGALPEVLGGTSVVTWKEDSSMEELAERYMRSLHRLEEQGKSGQSRVTSLYSLDCRREALAQLIRSTVRQV